MKILAQILGVSLFKMLRWMAPFSSKNMVLGKDSFYKGQQRPLEVGYAKEQ